jgi:hypothetical protein
MMLEPAILSRWMPGEKGCHRDYYRKLVEKWLASPDVTIGHMMELCRYYSCDANGLAKKITQDKGGY